MEIDQEILDEFHTEADESLDALEGDLMKLEGQAESGEHDQDLVDRIFRALHTLKGGAGFLGLDRMSKLAHSGENLLDEIRGDHVKVNTDVMDALLETNDKLRDLLTCSKSGDDPSSVDYEDLVKRLEALSHPAADAATDSDNAVEEPEETPEQPAQAESEQNDAVEATEPDDTPQDGGADVNDELLAEVMVDDKLGGAENEPSDEESTPAEGAEINEELLAEINNDTRLSGEGNDDEQPDTPQEASGDINQDLLDEINNDDRLGGDAAPAEGEGDKTPTTEKEPATQTEAQQTKPDSKKESASKFAENKTPKKKAPEKFERRGDDRRGLQDDRRKKPGRRDGDPQEVTIRVDTTRLDSVMNLVGELVLARNGLQRQIEREDVRAKLEETEHLPAIDEGLEALTRVSKDLQMSVLHTRMQPIKRVFDKIPRQVRELKNKLKKDIELVIEGESTEVDRTLVEELADPMVHLIRNALDHGLEEPEERQEFGKNTTGTLSVRAFYEGNNVVIQVADDGRGIDAEKVKQKALEKNIITPEEAEQMPDNEAHKLIMAAGFSTADEISDVSGRGVGMDVVSNKISKINGTVDLKSELGSGTTVSIYLPLTLAIVQALIVGSNQEGFAIPIGSISEVIKFKPADLHQVSGQDAIELREEVIPIRYLSELTRKGLAAKRPPKDAADGKQKKDDGYVIIVRDSNMVMGLVIDELIGQEEAVVKSITNAFEFNSAISGATISGDGHVHMILDVPYYMRENAKKNRRNGQAGTRQKQLDA